jgi:hypothetical protein
MTARCGPDPARARRGCRRLLRTFRDVPVVHLAMSMWDTDGDTNQRADLRAEAITETGFEIVFRTWGDSRVARIRADWIAIGEVSGEDDWEMY